MICKKLSQILLFLYFRLDHDKAVNVTCLTNDTRWEQMAGDFSSDAQFFVFTGVLSFLGTMACLVVYLFFPEMYFSENKKAPMFVSTITLHTYAL